MADQNNAGGFGFEGLLRGIGDLLHQAANISSDMRRRDGQRPTVESRMSVRSVDGEEIGSDFFGLRDILASAEARRGDDGAEAAPPPLDRREPVIEIIATPSAISAIVELPGADPSTISARIDQDMVTIAASGSGVEYAAEALLPEAVLDSKREQSFRNGVLELRWPRVAPTA